MAKKVEWVKITTDIFDNRKIKQIEAMNKGDVLLVIWFKLLCLAGVINDHGAVYITPEIPYISADLKSVKALADELKKPPATVKLALDTFRSFGMIEIEDNGVIVLPGWSEHQNVDGLDKIREQNRKRQQRKRDKKKTDGDNSDENANKSQALSRDNHVTVTQCHDTEKEEEGEEEKEEDIHSFIHSDTHTNGDFFGSVTGHGTKDRIRERRERLAGIGGGFVLLSDAQLDDLLDRLTLDEFDRYVSIVAECEASGRKYRRKTHYEAILEMAEKDRKLRG